MSAAKNELNFFSQFILENPKTKKDTIQEMIDDNKHFIFNFYASQPYYNEMMPKIKKADRGILFYKGMIKKGLKRGSAFFQEIIKHINRVNKRDEMTIPELPKERKKIKFYKLPKIDELKIKVNQINNIKKKKIKLINLEKEKKNNVYSEQVKNKIFPYTCIRKKSPIISSYNNFNNYNNRYLNSNNSTSQCLNKNENESLTDKDNNLILTSKNNNLNTKYKSYRNLRTISKDGFFKSKVGTFRNCNSINDMNYIIDKCKEELNKGKEVEDSFLNYNNDLKKKIQEKLDNNQKFNMDKQVIEDRKIKDKYVKLEEKNYQKIKKNMNQKMSNDFAYQIRKELEEILKIKENAEAYLLHLNEVNKINEKMGKRRIIGRKVIDKVNSLCDLGFQRKEFLKSRIDEINDKNIKYNQNKEYLVKDDYYLHINHKNKNTGNLIPKLIAFQKENEKKIEVGSNVRI